MRKFQILVLLVGVALLAAACAPVSAPPVQPTTGPAATTAPVATSAPGATTAPAATTAAVSKTGEFHGAWPYSLPPNGHFNSFLAANLINLGIYYDLIVQPMAMYQWADGTWVPLMATAWENKGDTFEVTLRDAVWSNGTPFTAQDVVTTFNIDRLSNLAVWKYITNVEAKDDHTVVFTVGTPSTLLERLILRRGIRDHETYGAIGDKVAALYESGLDSNSEEGKAIAKELNDFRPAGFNASGPYNLDVGTLTESQATLNLVPTAWNADQVQFGKIIVYQGETAAVTPLVLSKDVDYATHGFPPATEKGFTDAGIRIQRPPLLTGPALYFNHSKYPFAKPEVRQAMAHVINRSDAGIVSLGDSGKAVQYMTGMSDNLASQWMSPEDLAKLNTYELDTAKAEELLTGIGFTKGADGIWVDDQGNPMDYELIVPSDFADWSATAEIVAQNLSQFGIKTTVRGVQSQQQLADVNAGNFTLAIRAWGGANPHPLLSYEQDFLVHNYIRTSATGRGMDMPLMQTSTVAGGEVDLEKMTADTAAGTDLEAQKAVVSELALIYNELLPQIPLWERYGNNPLVDVRTTWPAADDPIFQNNPGTVPGGDNFTVLMILDGRLKPN